MNKKKKIMWSLIAVVLLVVIAMGTTLGIQSHWAKEDEKAIQKQATPEKMTDKVVSADFKKSEQVERPSLKELKDFQQSKAYQELVNQAIGQIEIPKIHLKLPILGGTTSQHLKVGATTFRKNQELGKGNYVLLGHNMGRAGVLFSDLNKLQLNDEIQVTLAQKDGTKKKEMYVVSDKQVVSYRDGEVMNDTDDTRLTLITCDKATSTTQRIVIRAIPKK
ncbi:class A sortase [Listeria aquatica]|uniref:class A sortase n=1 Tax=Listeria aquatica TaxID=1494960 RepID=UPI003F6F6EDE